MVTDTVKMNAEKLKQLQANVRIGGKGTVRRKKKVVHRTATTDDKKLQSSLKKLSGKQIRSVFFFFSTGKSFCLGKSSTHICWNIFDLCISILPFQ